MVFLHVPLRALQVTNHPDNPLRVLLLFQLLNRQAILPFSRRGSQHRIPHPNRPDGHPTFLQLYQLKFLVVSQLLYLLSVLRRNQVITLPACLQANQQHNQ